MIFLYYLCIRKFNQLNNKVMKARIAGHIVEGLKNIVSAAYYEGVEKVKLSDGRTILVYGDGTYEFINGLRKQNNPVTR